MNSKRNILHYRMRGKISVLYEQNYDIIQFNNKLFSLDNGIQGGEESTSLTSFCYSYMASILFSLNWILEECEGTAQHGTKLDKHYKEIQVRAHNSIERV